MQAALSQHRSMRQRNGDLLRLVDDMLVVKSTKGEQSWTIVWRRVDHDRIVGESMQTDDDVVLELIESIPKRAEYLGDDTIADGSLKFMRGNAAAGEKRRQAVNDAPYTRSRNDILQAWVH